MVLDQPFPPDARVEREALALIEAGYEVHLLCMRSHETQEREEMYQGIHLHRVSPDEVADTLPWLGGIRTQWLYRGILKNLQRKLRNIDTVWQTLIHRFVSRFQLDILHIHDLRLVDTGLSVARRYQIPLVADLHENYPALMEMLKGRDNPRRGRKARVHWEKIERNATAGAHQIITVADESKERLVGWGIHPHKITVVPNTVDIEKFETAFIDPGVVRQYKQKFLITYVGHVNAPHRGIHIFLEALARLKDEIPEIYFVAAGAIRDHYMDQLSAQIARLGLSDYVRFTGWVDEMAFPTYITAADVCICPHLESDHTNSGIPNKMYLYHLFGKPVVASSCRPYKRYLDDSQGGICFESGNVDELVTAITRLYHDEHLRHTLGENGRKAVRSTYNWQQSASRLVSMYAGLLQRGTSAEHLQPATMSSTVSPQALVRP